MVATLCICKLCMCVYICVKGYKNQVRFCKGYSLFKNARHLYLCQDLSYSSRYEISLQQREYNLYHDDIQYIKTKPGVLTEWVTQQAEFFIQDFFFFFFFFASWGSAWCAQTHFQGPPTLTKAKPYKKEEKGGGAEMSDALFTSHLDILHATNNKN